MKKYSGKLYFYKEDSEHKHDGINETPNFKEYLNETQDFEIETWESHINEILRTYPNVSYIETSNIEDIGLDELHEKKLYGNYYLCVNYSPIHGKGAFAKKDISATQIILTLDGYILDMKNDSDSYPSGEWNALGNNKFLVREQRTIYGFINHSRLPNAKINIKDRIIVAIKDIKEGDEITLDYREEDLPLDYFLGYGGTYL